MMMKVKRNKLSKELTSISDEQAAQEIEKDELEAEIRYLIL